jgi:hypothetical protein
MTKWNRVRRYAVLVCGVGAIACSGLGEDKTIEWHNNYGAALRVAKETRKPLFVEFRCEA